MGEDAHAWHFTTGASPQQADTSSCGVFALVTAIYVLSARTIPAAPYNVKMWRLVLAYLVAPESANGEAIWPYSPASDRQRASVEGVGHLCGFHRLVRFQDVLGTRWMRRDPLI